MRGIPGHIHIQHPPPNQSNDPTLVEYLLSIQLVQLIPHSDDHLGRVYAAIDYESEGLMLVELAGKAGAVVEGARGGGI